MYRGLAKSGLDRIKGAKGALTDLQIALDFAKEAGNKEGIATISDTIRELKDGEQNKQN